MLALFLLVHLRASWTVSQSDVIRSWMLPRTAHAELEPAPAKVDLETYRTGNAEQARTRDLLALLPRGRATVLDIGAREGYFSRLLTRHFDEVTALDLERPRFTIPGVRTVAGDVTRLAFADASFDCVFCAEVLEHVPDVEQACREIVRVARHEAVIGVPFEQDLRVGRTTCGSCGKVNPPYGHVNSFDEARLVDLFAGMRVTARSFVGRTREASNRVATALMDLGGNPWGTYDQDEPCIHCGAVLRPPPDRTLPQRALSGLAARLERWQRLVTPPRSNWIHLALSK
jgi:SAM-dependent methyltransferase